MKVPVISSLLLMLGLASPLLGIERPKALDDKASEAAPSDAALVVEEADLKEENPLPWLGVFGETVDPALAAQLGLEGGVVLRFVAEGSPAADAGLKMHDVIESVDGQVLNTQDGLRAAVFGHQPGDTLKMKVVSGGAKKDVDVMLGDRPDDLPQVPGGLRFENEDEALLDPRRKMLELDGLVPQGEFDKQVEDQLKRMQERFRKLEIQPGLLDGELKELFKGLPNMKLDLKSTGSVTLFDGQGSVEMKTNDGGTEVEVRNKAGELLYEGPWDNEQDKAAVDAEVRERIERLSFNKGKGGLRFQLNGAELFPQDDKPEIPADAPEEAPAAPAVDAPAAPAEEAK